LSFQEAYFVAEFVEVETGKGSDALDRRPQLSAALEKPGPYAALLPSASSIGFRETCTSFPG